MRKIIRTDGTTTDLAQRLPMAQISASINADTLDTVVLRHMGHPMHVMVVDDSGHTKGLPVNEEATRLYRFNCLPGATHQIRGDVVVVPDADFA